jgi:hypothetical protein
MSICTSYVVISANPLNVNNENANERKKRGRGYVFSAYALITEIDSCGNQIKLQASHDCAQRAQWEAEKELFTSRLQKLGEIRSGLIYPA